MNYYSTRTTTLRLQNVVLLLIAYCVTNIINDNHHHPPHPPRNVVSAFLLPPLLSFSKKQPCHSNPHDDCRSLLLAPSSSSSSSSSLDRENELSNTEKQKEKNKQIKEDDDDDDDDDKEVEVVLVNKNTLQKTKPSQQQRRRQQQQPTQQEMNTKKRRMDLMWCSTEYCKDSVRERVVGEHNNIILDGPATGQVVYTWGGASNSSVASSQQEATANMLLLVKPNDEELIKTAAHAVQHLTTQFKICISLDATIAAKLKHYYGVDNEYIHLFEPMEDPVHHYIQDTTTPTPATSSTTKIPLLIPPSFYNGEETTPTLEEISNNPYDLICTLGGDGILMHTSLLFQGPVPPILSIAGGSLGFLTPFTKAEMIDAIRISLGLEYTNDQNNEKGQNKNEKKMHSSSDDDNYNSFQNHHSYPPNQHQQPLRQRKLSFGLGNTICISIRMRLDCKVLNREGIVRAQYNVLNEVVIDRGSSPYLAALECFCDDVHLTTVQADGIIFATPTGSTAYSMAAGGSVVHPAVPAILVTPICPHVLSFRSMIFPDHVVLRCYVPDDARAEASVAFDGKYRRTLTRGDSVSIQMSKYPVPTINKSDHSSDWLGSLKTNFNFNTRPRQRPL